VKLSNPDSLILLFTAVKQGLIRVWVNPENIRLKEHLSENDLNVRKVGGTVSLYVVKNRGSTTCFSIS
jgi:hypothetical protein